MFLKIICPALLFFTPATASAQPTHELIRAPAGKTVGMYRPIAQQAPALTKCHPDPTKSVMCEAHNRNRAEALAKTAAMTAER